MDNPKQDIVNKVLIPILSTDITAVNNVIDNYVSDDIVFAHPFLLLKGKAEFSKMYNGWSKQMKTFNKLIVHAVFYDEELQRVVTDIDYQFHPLFFPTFQPQQARVLTIFHLKRIRRSGATKFLITRQEDYYPTDTICAAITPEPFSRFTKTIVTCIMRFSGIFTIYILGTLSLLLSSVYETLGLKQQTTEKELIMESVDHWDPARKPN
ncbi:hypothetical protein DFJ77DRAFT_550313 [Powellomyces hirtus]|nr:hypothetical protein DFJ77DRAFT_550313 [Powellomyces hirtus]